jgi:hypothetical protein
VGSGTDRNDPARWHIAAERHLSRRNALKTSRCKYSQGCESVGFRRVITQKTEEFASQERDAVRLVKPHKSRISVSTAVTTSKHALTETAVRQLVKTELRLSGTTLAVWNVTVQTSVGRWQRPQDHKSAVGILRQLCHLVTEVHSCQNSVRTPNDK